MLQFCEFIDLFIIKIIGIIKSEAGLEYINMGKTFMFNGSFNQKLKMLCFTRKASGYKNVRRSVISRAGRKKWENSDGWAYPAVIKADSELTPIDLIQLLKLRCEHFIECISPRR